MYPEQVCGIVCGMCPKSVARDSAAIEHINRVNLESRILVEIGNGEEEFHRGDFQTRLFAHLAAHSVLAGLKTVGEASGEIQRAFGGLFRPTDHTPFAPLILYQSHCGSRGVEIISEAAVLAMFGLTVMFNKTRRPAFRAKTK